MKTKSCKMYRFYDFFQNKWCYAMGNDKYDAINLFYGKEQSRFIINTFKIERIYDKSFIKLIKKGIENNVI